jgi:hypothetical protein
MLKHLNKEGDYFILRGLLLEFKVFLDILIKGYFLFSSIGLILARYEKFPKIDLFDT